MRQSHSYCIQVILLLLVACAPETGIVIKQKSLSNIYVAEVAVEKKKIEIRQEFMSSSSKKESNIPPPRIKYLKVWIPTIRSAENQELLYKDDKSKMFARFNIYTGWDKNDNYWVHNSDNGNVWRYHKVGDKWIKSKSSKANMPKGLK